MLNMSEGAIIKTSSTSVRLNHGRRLAAAFTLFAAQIIVAALGATLAGCNLLIPLESTNISAPRIDPAGGTLVRPVMAAISSPSGGAIHFTLDGSEPTTKSLRYSVPFFIDSALTIKAAAYSDGELGPTATAVFAWTAGSALSPPAFHPAAAEGNYSLSILGPTWVTLGGPVGAAIYYTMDNTAPTQASGIYSGPIYITGTTTFRAVAVKNGSTSAETVSRYVLYDTVPAPSIVPANGSDQIGAFMVTLYANGAQEVRYTTDGSAPNEASTVYDGPFFVNFIEHNYDADENSLPGDGQILIKAIGVIGDRTSYPSAASYNLKDQADIDAAFWGSWLAIGDNATWYLSGDGVLVDGTLKPHSGASSTRVTFSDGVLDLINDSQLRFDYTSGQAPLNLYRGSGAVNSFSAGLKDSSPSAPLQSLSRALGGRALSNLGGIKVVIRNLKNPANFQELTTSADGSITASGAVIGDEYSVTIPPQTDIPAMLRTSVTPLYDGQNLGRVDLNNTGANFKMDLETEVLADRFRADGVTPIRYRLHVRNLGSADLDEANYRNSSPDGLLVVSGNASGILGTVFRGASRTIELDLVATPIASDYEDKHLTVEIIDGRGFRSWTDTLTLRYLKQVQEFKLNLASPNFHLPALLVDPAGTPYRLNHGTNTLTWRPGVYTLAVSKSAGVYSIGLDTAAHTDWYSFTDYQVSEPDDSAANAAVLAYGSAVMKYLGPGDVDFHTFEIPIGFLDVTHTRTPRESGGATAGNWTARLAASDPQAVIYYTTDGSEPSAATGAERGTRYLSGDISLDASVDFLKVHAYREHYQSAAKTFAAPPRLINVAGGSFSRSGQTVNLSGFKLAETEVTQSLYATVMGANPSYHAATGTTGGTTGSATDTATRPVENVSWYGAIAFCNRLSLLEGLTPAYSIGGLTNPDSWGIIPAANNQSWNAVALDPAADGYRLPTEAQWEYAYRAGTTSAYYWGDDVNAAAAYAWYSATSVITTQPVGGKTANAWGFHDMAGNVWEWVWDWWDSAFPTGVQTDPTGPATSPATGSYRISRGGSYYTQANQITAYYRNEAREPQVKDYLHGFRVARP
jgi:formylglycine-generating enzyme required for sulfatase activity